CFQQGASELPIGRIDVTLANRGGSTIAGTMLFVYSTAANPMSVPFTVQPNGTAVIQDAFHPAQPDGIHVAGSVRIQVTPGTASDLAASVRTVHAGEDGSNYGFSEVALDTFGGIGLGFQTALLSGGGDPADATMGLYTSSAGAGAQFTATLFGPDGAPRGSRAFNLVNNTLEEFTPPASAFGLEGQPGDVVLISGGPGSVRAYMRFHDTGSGDNALEVATKAVTDGVVPWVSNGLAADGTGPVSDLLLW